MNKTADTAKIHILLELILAVLLLRLAMDYSPFGKTSIAGVIAVVSAYAGLGLLLWVAAKTVISLFAGRGNSTGDGTRNR
jgi:hypothetical protein